MVERVPLVLVEREVLVVERSPGEVLVREEVVLWLGTLPYIARAWQHLQIQRDSYT